VKSRLTNYRRSKKAASDGPDGRDGAHDRLMDAKSANLIARTVSGDHVALEGLLLTHYDGLLRHIERRLPASIRGAVSPADILQQTFVRVFRHVGQFKGDSPAAFFAWLRTIANRTMKDAVKSAQRKKRGAGLRQVHASQPADASTISDMVQRVAQPAAATPSQSVARREVVRAVQVAMAKLPDDYQQAVRLRYFDGKSVEQAAEAMGRTPGAVRGLIDRAKERLRAAMSRLSLYL
jgi:RNA polymerase sigma-70 factor (ECF subfamily)